MTYFECACVALGLDLTLGLGLAFGVAAELGELAFPASLIASTLPAIGANVVDKYVNQNISDNKYFQYGATALEAGLMNVAIGEAHDDFKGNYIKDLIKLQCSGDDWIFKLIFANAVAQGLLFHYILSEEETSESGDGDGPLFDDPIDDNNQLDINDNGNQIIGEFQS